ncbi:MAG: ABC transporter substrate-binding protein [Alphaproteobacteria bacterium]|nr:ABC transporter substrate-binding protein [Alphaproteobacteria bacterium]
MKTTKSTISRRHFLQSSSAAITAAGLFGSSPLFAQGNDEVKLQFMYPVGVSGDINRIVTEMITEFNTTHEKIQVEAIYAGSYDNTEQKVMTSLGVGDPPATWLPINSALQTFLSMDALADVTALAKADDIYQDFLPGFLSICESEEKLYGLPFQCSTPVLYYNKEIFAKAGINKAPDTWAELMETAKALTVRDGSDVTQWGLTFGGGWHDWIFESFVRQNGLVPWQQDKVMFDAPESIDALEFWVQMVKAGVMPAASTWQGSANDFMAGRTAMLYHSTGSLTNLRTSSPFDVGVAFMPKNKTYGATIGGGPILMAKDQPDAHLEASWTFARWMTNTQNQTHWCKSTGYIAARKSSWEGEELKSFINEVPAAKVALDQAAYAGAFLQVPGYHKVREYLKSAIDGTLAGDTDPTGALKEATVKSNKEIERVMRRRS